MSLTLQLCLYGFMVFLSAFETKAERRQVTNSGREFILAFIQHRDLASYELVIVATEGHISDVLISAPLRDDINVMSQLGILDTNVMHVVLNPELALSGTQVQNNGVWITSPHDVTLQCYSVYSNLSSDSFMAYPVESLDLDYVVVNYCMNDNLCEFAVVGTEDKTNVSISLVIDRDEEVMFRNSTYVNGTVLVVMVNRYQTVQIQSKGDLTGTRIRASAAVAVFSGAPLTETWQDIFTNLQLSNDHLVEQLPPVGSWGNNYVISPFPNTPVENFIKIVVNESTDLTINDLNISIPLYKRFTLYELPEGILTVISSDHSILVAQYSQSVVVSYTLPLTNSDSSFAIVPPVSRWRNSYAFSAFNPVWVYSSDPYITIVTTRACIFDIILNGEIMNITWTVRYDNARVSFQLNDAINRLSMKSQSCTFYATLIGHWTLHAWSMSLGWYFKDIWISEDSSIVVQGYSPSVTVVSTSVDSSDDLTTSTTAELLNAIATSVENPFTVQTPAQYTAVSTQASVMLKSELSNDPPDTFSEYTAPISTVKHFLQPSTDYPSISYVYANSDDQLQATVTAIISTVGTLITEIKETEMTTDLSTIIITATEVMAAEPEQTAVITTTSRPVTEFTAEITTTSSPTVKDPSYARCYRCVCRNSTISPSVESLKILMEYLAVDKRNLSATIRKHISVEDDRPSAVAVGSCGIIFLCLAGLVLCVNDILSVFSFYYSRRNRIKLEKNARENKLTY